MSSRTHAPETNIASDSDEDPPQLSEHALTALQEFYAEQLAREQLLEATLQAGGGAGGGAGAGPVPIEEDWQLSQFWYDDITAQALAEEALQASHNRIACISCPTLYSKLLELKPKETKVILLEYDRRFEVYGEDFVFYDYNKPLDIPNSLSKHSFDLVVADPPFLAEECLQKTAETVRHLARDRILLCTGAVMEELAFQLLGVRPCTFVPRHTRNLANEFRCYTNYTQTTLNPAPSTQC